MFIDSNLLHTCEFYALFQTSRRTELQLFPPESCCCFLFVLEKRSYGIPKTNIMKKQLCGKSNTFQNTKNLCSILPPKLQTFKTKIFYSHLQRTATPVLTMKKTGSGCLSDFAAVPTCCVVTVRLPPMRYFQSCPFVLPACQAGTCPKSRKTKMSETPL